MEEEYLVSYREVFLTSYLSFFLEHRKCILKLNGVSFQRPKFFLINVQDMILQMAIAAK